MSMVTSCTLLTGRPAVQLANSSASQLQSGRPAAVAPLSSRRRSRTLSVCCANPKGEYNPKTDLHPFNISPDVLVNHVPPRGDRWQLEEHATNVQLWFEVPGQSNEDLTVEIDEDVLVIKKKTTWDQQNGGGSPRRENNKAASDVMYARLLLPAAYSKEGVKAAAAAASSSPGPVQDHIIAERRRREKINQRFIELSTVIPGLKKMDKATILGDAVKYVRELQEKVKTLEEDGSHGGGSMQSAVLVKKKPCCLPDDEGTASGSNGGLQSLPEIEARLSDKSVLLRIHCDNARGLLVKVLSEVEKMSLAITHTNVMPFPASTAIITITAKVEEGFNATVDDIVRRINSVLHQHYSGSPEEITRR